MKEEMPEVSRKDELVDIITTALEITDDALPLVSTLAHAVVSDDLLNVAEDRVNLRAIAFEMLLGELLAE